MAYQKKGYKGKPKGTKKELTVKWIVKDKKIIKFVEEEEKTYKLADNVLEFLDEIKSNVPVNVTISNDKVIFIQVNENADVKNEVEPEPEEQDNNVKSESSNETYTVKAISKTRDYYLFDECGEKEWFTVAKNVKNFLKNVKKGDVLEIKHTTEKDNKGRETRLINYAKVVSEKVEEVKEESKKETTVSTKKSSYRDEESTDKRTSLMVAKDIIIALINKGEIVTSAIPNTLKDLTKKCYETINNI